MSDDFLGRLLEEETALVTENEQLRVENERLRAALQKIQDRADRTKTEKTLGIGFGAAEVARQALEGTPAK